MTVHDAPTILAFDTAGPWCTAALAEGERVVAHLFEEMRRGQAERLRPMIEKVMAEAGVNFTELDAIGVGIGPGNFTGIRISVAMARGLALGLNSPAVGVSGFEVLRRILSVREETLALLPAPRDQWLWEMCREGTVLDRGIAPRTAFSGLRNFAPPGVIRCDTAQNRDSYEIGGWRIGCDAPAEEVHDLGHRIAPQIAAVAAWRIVKGGDIPRPSPLYIRPADATPPSDPPPAILP